MKWAGYKSWDEVYLAHLERGDDHGYAYYAAEMWQKKASRGHGAEAC